MARKWLIGGLAVGVGALVVAPDARTWLRRRLGLEAEDRRWFEEEGADAPEYEGDEPLDTREARFSLRARLSEDCPGRAGRPGRAGAVRGARPSPSRAVAGSEPEPEPFPAARASPQPEPEPFAAPATPEPAPFGAMTTPEPYAPPAAPEPAAPSPIPSPRPSPAGPPPSPRPRSSPSRRRSRRRQRDTAYAPYESVPSIVPEADAPKTPGEDTDEVGPLPAAEHAGSPGRRRRLRRRPSCGLRDPAEPAVPEPAVQQRRRELPLGHRRRARARARRRARGDARRGRGHRAERRGRLRSSARTPGVAERQREV